jgi:preprotein translocase subunit SecA
MVMERFSFPEDMPIQHPLINRSIENAQRQVESRNFEIRKHVLEYDDVMNKQREVIYDRRTQILKEEDLKEYALELVKGSVGSLVDLYINPNDYRENWNLEELEEFLSTLFAKNLFESREIQEKISNERIRVKELKEILTEQAVLAYEERERDLSPEILRKLEKLVILNIIDSRWREHLLEMDYLKEGIGLRAYGQKDPLVEYKHESYNLFKSLVDEIKVDAVKLLFNAKVMVKNDEPEKPKEMALKNIKTSGPKEMITDSSKASKPEPIKSNKVGRNDPCPCGSGKKYKKCCGR